MPKSRSALLLYAALFCCAGFALGQSMGASSAEVNASPPSAEVRAAPSAAANVGVPGIAARAYRMGSGSGHLQGTEAVAGMNSRHPQDGSLGLGAVKIDNANAKSMLETGTRHAAARGRLSMKEAAALRRYKTGRVRTGMLYTTAAERMAAGAGKTAALKKGTSGLIGTYTRDFPDSTRGTALVSPPDRGTASPLDWSPGLGFSFPDFAEREFLSPSLQMAHRPSGARRVSLFGRQRLPQSLAETKPKEDLLQTSLPSFETSVPSIDSTLLSPLDQP
ncbi:MAG TPA: hypothetical protein VN669_12070 [Candidatus Acidoferrales bacterium]|nr:hypothetical protein [Candidatus Acidoferrales bacterium]